MDLKHLQTSDGVSSELRVFALHKSGSVILVFPAMGVPARNYDELAKELNELGLQVVIAELRGIGSSSVRAHRKLNFGYQEMLELDFPCALQTVAKLFPQQPIFIMGHSLGGQLAALMMAQQQAEGDATQANSTGLILSASCSIYYRGWAFPRNFFILFFTQLGALIALVLGYFPGKQLGFGGREAKTVILDWARSARTGNYQLSNSQVDYELALSKMQKPILTINFSDDDFAPKTATEQLLKKLSNSDLMRTSINREKLGAKTADHFSWLKHPQAVAATVQSWVTATLAKPTLAKPN